MKIKATLKTIGAILYKNRAKIETIAGITSVVVGTGIIISKAKKATEIAEELESRNKVIRIKDENGSWVDKTQRSHFVKDTLKYGAVEYTKTYILGLGLVTGGLGLIGISDVTMSKEISTAWGVAASYAATIDKVKSRVIEDQGEAKWQEYYLGPQCTKVDVLPDGTVIQTTTPVNNPNMSANLPPHCLFFDESNPNWEKDPIINRDYLENHLRWLNDRLDVEEFLFENDIRRDIGAYITKSGWTSGITKWKIDPVTGDRVRNYLSFGLELKNEATQRFMDGIEPTVLIQLNIEDNILDKLQLPII